MLLKISFQENSNLIADLIPHRIRFTSSINQETSTITLHFYNPTKILNSHFLFNKDYPLKASLCLDLNLNYTTNDIRIIWVKGRPFILQAVFLFTSKIDSKKLKSYLESHKLLD